MKTTGSFLFIVASILLLCIAIPGNYAQGEELGKKIDNLIQDIKNLESHLKLCKLYKQKLDSGKYYLIYDKDWEEQLIRKDDLIKDTDKP